MPLRIFTLLFIVQLLPSSGFAQLQQNSNWYFGEGLALQFGGGTVTSGTSPVNSIGINQSSIISDGAGNVICSTDGNKVFNADNVEIHDFASTTSENILIPDPASSDRFYLFRSGSNGLNYSIVDMTLNGGTGGINTNEEDIDLGDYNVQMVAARNSNATDFWLITSDNENGNSDNVTVTVYSVTANGVVAGDSEGQYFIFGGWYNTIDDMRISPECSKIVMAYKGHYLVLIQFDNETGMLSNLLSSSLDAVNSFSSADLDQWEFSADGNFLFDLEDHAGIARYSLEDWNLTSISNSEEIIVPLDWNSIDIWTDLKLAIDGNIYLHNVDSEQIDKIINTTGNIDDVEVVYGVLSFEDGLTNFFPNISNFSCISLDAGLFHLYECLGDSTELWYSSTISADSVFWDFGDPDSGIMNTSTAQEPIHVFSAPGVYDVTLTVYFEGLASDYAHSLTIYEVPSFELGPDIAFCSGDFSTIGVESTPGYTYYWNTGAITPSVEIGNTGTYSLEITNGECSFADALFVEVFNPVSSTLENEIVECGDNPVFLDAGANNAETILWNTGESSETITVENSGVYSVTLSNTCFESTYSVEVIFVSIPELITDSSLDGCNGDTLVLSSNYNQGSFLWNTGDTSPTIEVTVSGQYSIAANYLGCTRTDIIDVQLQDFIPLSWIEMPNIFTPNGDNLNQEFRPFVKVDPDYPLCNSPVVKVEMNIYNRWGNLLEENTCAWDARSSGAEVYNDGVYYYIVEIQSTCQDRKESIQKEGYVHIVSEKK